MRPVCLIGNLCIDIVVRGVAQLPQWGRETAGRDYRIVPSGQVTYTALALRALGAPVCVLGYVGEDAWGGRIRATLAGAGVDVSGVESVKGGRTAVTIAAVRPDGERAFLSDFACLCESDESIIERHFDLLEASSAVGLLGTFSFPGLNLGRAAAIIGAAKGPNRSTILDTGWDPKGFEPETVEDILSSLGAFTLFMPNSEEAKACSNGSDPKVAARLFRERGAEEVVVKMGSEGCYALTEAGESVQRAFRVEAVDTVGAGDVFNAAFLYGRLAGRELESALRFAAAAAAIRVEQPEGPPAGSERIEAFLEARKSR